MTRALRVPDYLGHIAKAIERIHRYTADIDEVAFLNSDLVQDAVIRNIEIIGEASNDIQRVSRRLPHGTTTFLGRSCTRCVTVSRTGMTRWIWKSSGRRSTAIFRGCISRYKGSFKASRVTTTAMV